MGALISVTVANLTMEALEERALASFAPQPRTFLRHVDDCFCVLPKDWLQSFRAHLNGMEPVIQFTTEEGPDGRLAFLGVLVKRDGVGLSFTVFRKKAHTGRYLHFNSVHPAAHKPSVVASLLRKADRICSKPEDRVADNTRVRYEL